MVPSSYNYYDEYASKKMNFYFQVLNFILNDDVTMLQKIYTSFNNSYHHTFLFCAARNDKLKSLQWLWQIQPVDDPLLPVESISSQSKECLLFLHTSGCSWNERLTYTASYLGNLDCLKYAIQNGCEYSTLDVLTGLNKHFSKLSLDDWWWRDFLFREIYPEFIMFSTQTKGLNKLFEIVEEYKHNLEQIQTIVVTIFSSDDSSHNKWIPKDVIEYVLLGYI